MRNMEETRPVWLEINLDNLAYNFREIRKIVNEKAMIMAVIKANGYGHKYIELATMYKENGADRLAVAALTEAIELRHASIPGPLMVLGYTPTSQFNMVLENDIIQCIYNYLDACELSKEAVKQGKTAKVHIKIDSGMSRIGFLPSEESIEDIIKISKLPNIEIEGIFTHFAKADEVDKTFTQLQYERFNSVVIELENRGINIPIKHVSNSATIIDLPEYNLDMVRPGIILYGYYPSDEVNKEAINLKPAMTLKAKISNIKTLPDKTGISYGHIFSTKRQSKIATIPLGYADGYSRSLSGKASAHIGGIRVPLVGRVCMDQLMLDVTEVESVNIGDEVVLFGQGNEGYPHVDEIASLLGTINYEVVCMMGRRIPRVYIKEGKVLSIKDYLLD